MGMPQRASHPQIGSRPRIFGRMVTAPAAPNFRSSEANAKASSLKRYDYHRWAEVSYSAFDGHIIGRFLPLNVWRASNP